MNRDTPKHSGKSSFIYPTQMRASPGIPKMHKTKKPSVTGRFFVERNFNYNSIYCFVIFTLVNAACSVV